MTGYFWNLTAGPPTTQKVSLVSRLGVRNDLAHFDVLQFHRLRQVLRYDISGLAGSILRLEHDHREALVFLPRPVSSDESRRLGDTGHDLRLQFPCALSGLPTLTRTTTACMTTPPMSQVARRPLVTLVDERTTPCSRLAEASILESVTARRLRRWAVSASLLGWRKGYPSGHSSTTSVIV